MVIVLIALGVGFRTGFAAVFYEVITFIGGALVACYVYVPAARVLAQMGLKNDKGLPSHSANFWGFIAVYLIFILVMSFTRKWFKQRVLRLPAALDTVLGVFAWLGFAGLIIGGWMLLVSFWSWQDMRGWVEQSSFTGGTLGLPRHMPSVYYQARNPNAQSLNISGSEIEWEGEQAGAHKAGTITTTPVTPKK